MNKVTRMLALTGMAIATTATIGAGAASAAQAASATPQAKASASKASDHFGNRTRVVGYFDNRFTCERVGRIGERRDRWDDYECYRVRFGFHRGDWVLVAEYDRRGHWGGGHWGGNGWDNDRDGWGDNGRGWDNKK